MIDLKPKGLPDYYRQKINLHDELEKQLRKELLKLDEKKEQPNPDQELLTEIEALLKQYGFTASKMLEILS